MPKESGFTQTHSVYSFNVHFDYTIQFCAVEIQKRTGKAVLEGVEVINFHAMMFWPGNYMRDLTYGNSAEVRATTLTWQRLGQRR